MQFHTKKNGPIDTITIPGTTYEHYRKYEKGINYLVNESIGKDVLNSKITKAEILETVVMTIGATSGLGAKRMLTGNRRSNALRMAAKNIVDLQPTIDVLVKEGSLTENRI